MARTLISAVKDNGPSEISRGAPMLPRFQRAATELVRCQRQLVCPVLPVNAKNAAARAHLPLACCNTLASAEYDSIDLTGPLIEPDVHGERVERVGR